MVTSTRRDKSNGPVVTPLTTPNSSSHVAPDSARQSCLPQRHLQRSERTAGARSLLGKQRLRDDGRTRAARVNVNSAKTRTRVPDTCGSSPSPRERAASHSFPQRVSVRLSPSLFGTSATIQVSHCRALDLLSDERRFHRRSESLRHLTACMDVVPKVTYFAGVSELVKPVETLGGQALCMSASGVGLLIQATVGSLGAVGVRPENRSGLAA